MSNRQPQGANPVYSSIVKNESDVLGHVAYSVYKSHKIAEIKRLCAEKGVDYISPEYLEPFIRIAQSDRQIQFYKEHADRVVNYFLNTTVSEILNIRQQELESQYKKEYEELLKTCKPRPWYIDVGIGMLASFLFLLIGYILLIVTGSWEKLIASL